MSTREELDQVLKSIGEQENKIADVYQTIDPLIKKRDELIWNIILEEKLFSKLQWQLEDSQTLSCFIRDEEALQKLFGGLYITNLSPLPGITTSISSDYFSFYFADTKLIPSFVRKMDLIMDATEITDKLQRCRREVESLEILCHTLGIRSK